MAQNVVFGHTFQCSNRLINSAHFRFSRTSINRGAPASLINPTDVGVKLNALVKNFIDVSATNSFATGCGTCAPGHFKTNSYQVADDVATSAASITSRSEANTSKISLIGSPTPSLTD